MFSSNITFYRFLTLIISFFQKTKLIFFILFSKNLHIYGYFSIFFSRSVIYIRTSMLICYFLFVEKMKILLISFLSLTEKK